MRRRRRRSVALPSWIAASVPYLYPHTEWTQFLKEETLFVRVRTGVWRAVAATHAGV
jgi:hypothetical protein